MSNGNKVLPYSSTTSSYNAGNIRRQSTVKLNSPDSRQDVIPHYVRASTGYFHDFCKYGRKHSSEAKTWHPLSKRKNKLPADEQSPARTLVGEGKRGTLVKQKLYTPPGSCMERGIDEVTMVEQKSSTSLVMKLKFRRGNIVDFQKETSSPRRLTFRWGRHVSESQDNNIRKRIFKKKGVDGDKSNTIPISGKIVLRHQDVQEKKDVQGLLNNVIEETASKLGETRKSKVKALLGAFEIVISLHNKPSAVSFLINNRIL
ncbi:hypothetical protein CQW23_29840 [Capsicum baccatum]|uniref:Calmodulin-binding domain-containing protein n=1 Tax=Capsicum baccatum TaxID=33114 RepID=A0A2G2VC16_CAPBA|nr:hypothetical protein CQW23_29840 [Capsicum baccatum]